MNGKNEPTVPGSARRGKKATRALLLLGVPAVIGILLVFIIAFKSTNPPADGPVVEAAAPAASVPETEAVPVPHSLHRRVEIIQQASAPKTSLEAPVVSMGPRTVHQIVAEMAELSSTSGRITPEQAEKFKHNFEELIQQGAASVPAIREFLDKNIDYYFANVSGGEQLGYFSLSAAFFDALNRIGGPEAQAAMLQALQTSASPSELLELSKNLDRQLPGFYHDQILNAARDALSMAEANQLGTNVELGPAYRVLQNFGQANTIGDMEKNDPAAFYNAVAMANLPEGQGLPALVDMARGTGTGDGSQTIATVMIAQMAGQNAEALDALTQLAEKGQIRNSTWMRLAPILAGDQYQLNNSAPQNPGDDASGLGTQNYSVVNGATTPEQINQRIALIDRFLDLVPADSAAAASLQRERGILTGKLSR